MGTLFAIPILAGRPNDARSEEIVTPVTSVKLREGPGLNQKVKGSLNPGEPLRKLGEKGPVLEIDGKRNRWFIVRRKDGDTGFVFGGFVKTVEPSPEKATPKPAQKSETPKESDAPPKKTVVGAASKMAPMRSDILPALLKEKGYEAPDTFKALLIEIVKNEQGGFTYYPMDYLGTSEDRDDWWPASTVKLFAAIAALEKSRALGFPPKSELTFHYEEETVTQTLEELVTRAITDSKNPEFDRLVELVGSDRLNRYFLTEGNGLPRTVMLRAYSARVKDPVTGKSVNSHSPRITLKYRERLEELPEKTAKGLFHCINRGNCTTLRELTEALRRVMMHESLPVEERYKLGPPQLKLLRSALKGEWARGGVNDALRAAFKGRPIEIFHKGGYADKWFSDVIFLRVNDTHEQWMISLVNRPGRESLNEASKVIAEMIATGELSARRKEAWQATDPKPGATVEVIARETWEALPPMKRYVHHEIKQITIHHQGVVFTDAKRAPERMRAMQKFHRSEEKNFGDVAYHFVIDPKGNIYQGRPTWAVGETGTDYDPTGHLLVCLMGDFEKQQPTEPQIDGLARLLAWATRELKVDPATIQGHRDVAHTTCPGKNLYAVVKDQTIAKKVEELAKQNDYRLHLVSGEEGREKILAILRGK